MSTVYAPTHQRSKLTLALFLMCSLFLAYGRPASADGAASTRNIILGAAAIAAAIIIHNNAVHHAAVAANNPVGTTADGGTVYADGHVAYPNGDVLYTSNGNGVPCGWASGEPRCGARPVAYYPSGYHGHRHDRDDRKERHHDRDDHHSEHHHDHD
jgi:hypothetical protein